MSGRRAAPASDGTGGDAPSSGAPLLEVRGLAISIGGERRSRFEPVSRVSFAVRAGEAVALVGESGSGKSLTALALLDLLPPAARVERGEIAFAGERVLGPGLDRRRSLRGCGAGIVFQDPLAALNPYLAIGVQIEEAVLLHRRGPRHAARARTLELLRDAGLGDVGRFARAFPHQLSGGQRQRAMIAMALAGDPKLLIADEPTTALDVTVQAQVLELFARLVRQRGLGLLLITHDLGVVASLADRVAVLRKGEVVEDAEVDAWFAAPAHPHSRSLLEVARALDRGDCDGAGAAESVT